MVCHDAFGHQTLQSPTHRLLNKGIGLVRGTAVSNHIPYGRQDVTAEDVSAVKEILLSDFLTQGPAVPKFEDTLAGYCSASFAVAVNSATSALHIALLALGVTKDDLVWTSPISFVASSNAALYCGAKVDFVDIDLETFNMCAVALESKLRSAARANALPKVIVPVHLAGASCDMARIYNIASSYGVKIVEDASHAIGASYHSRKVGSCQYSDVTIFSFHPVKIITTGEGGMAVTNTPDLADKMRLLRSHGITRSHNEMTKKPDGPWYYEQLDLGFNYRMTDIQAALGLSQITRLDRYIDDRSEIAIRYSRRLRDLPLKLPSVGEQVRSSWHLYIILVNPQSHSRVFNSLRSDDILVNLHYIPIPMQPYYQRLGHTMDGLPNAKAYYHSAISLPMYPTLSDSDQERVIEAVWKYAR